MKHSTVNVEKGESSSSPSAVSDSCAKKVNLPPQGNVLVLHLLSAGVEHALPAVDLHTDVQLKVDVSFSRWATEASAGRDARPAFAEQLTHSRKPRGLLMGGLAEEKMCNPQFFSI